VLAVGSMVPKVTFSAPTFYLDVGARQVPGKYRVFNSRDESLLRGSKNWSGDCKQSWTFISGKGWNGLTDIPEWYALVGLTDRGENKRGK
jgi:hypothetical protein